MKSKCVVSILFILCNLWLSVVAIASEPIRIATFNVALNRNKADGLIEDLRNANDPQILAVAEIIQRVRPHILLLNEFDYDAQGPEGSILAAKLFQKNYLASSQHDAKPIVYPYVYTAPSNTGVPSGFDLNNNGKVGDIGDTLGFGHFEGQYGMLILSKYPILEGKVRTFQKFLWKNMPNALLPDNPKTPDSNDWFSREEQDVVRLSSKSHWDVPINVSGEIIHILASHPVPPIFDGLQKCNEKRNHDEIRFWSDYITPGKNAYIYDDQGTSGGLASKASFVILGDLNSDPNDGNSLSCTVGQLLKNPHINASVMPSSKGAVEAQRIQCGVNLTQKSNPRFDTSDWGDAKGSSGNLHVDYVLPSGNLAIVDAHVFWPTSDDPLYRLVGDGLKIISSDHRMVRIDVHFKK